MSAVLAIVNIFERTFAYNLYDLKLIDNEKCIAIYTAAYGTDWLKNQIEVS